MALLAKKIWGKDVRTTNWESILKRSTFKSETNYICSCESRSAAERALELRIDILMQVYQGDYHTAAFDISTLLEGISSGKERIFFWGEVAEIEKTRRIFSGTHSDGLHRMDHLNIGTATIIKREEESGCAELSRTGSLSSVAYSTYANIKELEDIFCNYSENKIDVIYSTPRNRESTSEIRGGIAIQRQHANELNSSFLGWAPWYIMQGGYIEVLDYRESYTFPAMVLDHIRNIQSLFFISEDDADFVRLLIKLNFGFNETYFTYQVKTPIGDSAPIWKAHAFASDDLKKYNPIFIRHDETDGNDLGSLIGWVLLENFTCICIEIDLEQEYGLQYQKLVTDRGFHFVGLRIVPTMVGWDGQSPSKYIIKGMWVRLKEGNVCAEPYYLKLKGLSVDEESILKHLRRIFQLINM